MSKVKLAPFFFLSCWLGLSWGQCAINFTNIYTGTRFAFYICIDMNGGRYEQNEALYTASFKSAAYLLSAAWLRTT